MNKAEIFLTENKFARLSESTWHLRGIMVIINGDNIGIYDGHRSGQYALTEFGTKTGAKKMLNTLIELKGL